MRFARSSETYVTTELSSGRGGGAVGDVDAGGSGGIPLLLCGGTDGYRTGGIDGDVARIGSGGGTERLLGGIERGGAGGATDFGCSGGMD